MATQQELYIRNATETEARGPFSARQVADLAEAGQVTADTLFYDPTTEQWISLHANPDLMAVVFPEKKKLSLKAKEIKSLNETPQEARPISVNDMLAAAEGRTEDTRGKSDPQISMARAAKLGLYGAIGTLVAAAAAEILPSTDALLSMEGAKLLAQPLVVLGVVDVGLVIVLVLGMTSLYPFIRFRAALGLGLMGFMYFAQGLSFPLLLVAAGSIGLYLCTIVISLIPAILAVAAGVGGMGMLAWQFIAH